MESHRLFFQRKLAIVASKANGGAHTNKINHSKTAKLLQKVWEMGKKQWLCVQLNFSRPCNFLFQTIGVAMQTVVQACSTVFFTCGTFPFANVLASQLLSTAKIWQKFLAKSVRNRQKSRAKILVKKFWKNYFLWVILFDTYWQMWYHIQAAK